MSRLCCSEERNGNNFHLGMLKFGGYFYFPELFLFPRILGGSEFSSEFGDLPEVSVFGGEQGEKNQKMRIFCESQ